MKSTWLETEEYEGKLTIILEGQEWKNIVSHGISNLSEDGLLQKDVTTVQEVLDEGVTFETFWEAISQDLRPYLTKALQLNQLDPVGHSSLVVEEMSEERFTFVYTLQLSKPVTLGNYIGLPYHEEEVVVEEETVQDALNQVLHNFETLEEKDGISEIGDVVNIDFVGKIDDVAFDGGSDSNYDLELGSGNFIPGFEEQLTGMKAGDVRTIEVKFPEDYPAEDLMGRLGSFEVTVNCVKNKVIPELTDAFVEENQILNTSSVEELKKELYEQVYAMHADTNRQDAEDALLNAFVDTLSGDAPRSLVEEYLKSNRERFEQELSQTGMTLDQYMLVTSTTLESIEDAIYESSERMAKLVAGIEALALKENITVTEQEITEFLETLASQYGMEVSDLEGAVNETEVKGQILQKKVIDYLVENSNKD